MNFSLAARFSPVFTGELAAYMKIALNDTINEIIDFSNNKLTDIIRFPPGTIYQLSLIDQPILIAQLSHSIIF